MDGNFVHLCPVHPTSDLERDVNWYTEKVGFELRYKEEGYAVLRRDGQWLHLQWHKGTDPDPHHPSVTKIFVKDIQPIFKDMVERGTIKPEKLRQNTPWKTHEFGFFDLNGNAIFFVQDVWD